MKATILSLLLMVSLNSFAQLTKSETINYINERLAEVEGHYTYTTVNKSNGEKEEVKFKITKIQFGTEIGKKNSLFVRYSRDYESTNYLDDEVTDFFNPSKIQSISVAEDKFKTPAGYLIISLTGKVGLRMFKNSNKETTDSFQNFAIYFLQGDTTLADRLKKAFLYLSSLYKAEEAKDPFAN